MAKVMLVDGNSLTYRAYHALPTDITLASGQVTNAVFGFTSMLLNLVRDHKPDSVIVAFDRPEPTFRHEAVTDYKAGRAAAPDILRQQMGLVREVVETLRLPIVETPGFEADDVIATLATRARDAGDEVLIVTGDRDVYQLVEDPLVKVLYNRRGVSDYALYDEAGIHERTGVTPALYPQYAALRGDPSDNLPGVPGVGEKTAAKLITTYGGLEGVFAHLDEQTPKLRQNLAEHEDRVRQNARVMVLVRDVDLDVTDEQLRMEPFDPEAVRRLFDFLEFRTLHERLTEAFGDDLAGPTPTAAEIETIVDGVTSAADAAGLLTRLAADTAPLPVAASWTGAEGRSPLEGIAVVTDGDAGRVAWLPAALLDDPAVASALRALVGPGGRALAAHGAKPLMRALLASDVDVRTLALDTMLAAYLLDPAESRYLLSDLLLRYANLQLPAASSGPSEGQLDLDAGVVPPSAEAAARAHAVSRLVSPLLAALDAQGLRRLNDDVEVPLVRVLAKMEHAGVGVDVAELKHLNDTLAGECTELTAQIWEDAGEQFNVNSTVKLREILFDRLGLQPQKKTQKGTAYSTDAASLERLVGQHPIVEHLLRYREVEKLRSTYGEGLLSEVGADGRIHATFNQTVARTGRLSSDQPNLHNIPVRSEVGRTFRRAFVPAPGCDLLVADYNQIELRCIAHLAEDPGLIAAFESRSDIHTATAARVFGVDPAKVTIEQRSKAKMVSYGLAYGMQAFGLAQRLNIPVDEAAQILHAYFEAFPAVKEYMDRTVAEARERGYTETLFGRRRPIPELSARNYRIREAGERQAMNAGIQGLAADIFKVALVELDHALEREHLASRIILQVHDEVLLEVSPAEHDQALDLTRSTMAGACQLRVPLEVNLAFGPTWADAKL